MLMALDHLDLPESKATLVKERKAKEKEKGKAKTKAKEPKKGKAKDRQHGESITGLKRLNTARKATVTIILLKETVPETARDVR